MLGSMVVDDLSRNANFKVSATVRNTALANKCKEKIAGVNWLIFDANAPDAEKALKVIDGHEWVINAIGITKPLIHDDNALEVERAVRINSLFPHLLARKAAAVGARIIQIATDCVYSGRKGNYTESDEFDALDVYGKTKTLGEVFAPGFFNCGVPSSDRSLRNTNSCWTGFSASRKTPRSAVIPITAGTALLPFIFLGSAEGLSVKALIYRTCNTPYLPVISLNAICSGNLPGVFTARIFP